MTKSWWALALCLSCAACGVETGGEDSPADDSTSTGEVEGGWYTGTFLVNGSPHELRYQIVDGERVAEGDMLLGPANEPIDGLYSNTVNDSSHRWPNATIPFRIDRDSWTTADLAVMEPLIRQAIANWNADTPINFVEASDCESQTCVIIDGDDSQGCESDIGYSILERHTHLPIGCANIGLATHELGHAIGLLHEHSRADRDTYVDVHLENTTEDDQFFHSSGNDTIGPYDFDSVMHYGPWSFTANGFPTILRRDSWGTFGGGGVGSGAWRQLRTARTDNVEDLLVGDFTADGRDDVIKTLGATGWWLSSGATGDWTKWQTSNVTTPDLRVGQFDNDPREDVMWTNGTEWRYQSGGHDGWTSLRTDGARFPNIALGDFAGDGYTDAFRILGTEWQICNNARGHWQHLATTDRVMALSELRFGNFVGDARTDVMRKTGSGIEVSDHANGVFVNINAVVAGLDAMRVVDVDGDGRSDLVQIALKRYKVAIGGAGTFQNWGGGDVIDLDNVIVGNFDGNPGEELLAKGVYTKPTDQPNKRPSRGDRGGVTHIYEQTLIVSHAGKGNWEFLAGDAPTSGLASYLHGDFDGDGHEELLRVFHPNPAENLWFIQTHRLRPDLANAESRWQTKQVLTEPPDEYRVGEFDPTLTSTGHRISDLLRKRGNSIQVAEGGHLPWVEYNTLAAPLSALLFGDFDGNGITDILYTDTAHGQWQVSWGGTAPFIYWGAHTESASQLRVGDFDGDGRDDVAKSDGTSWSFSSAGLSAFTVMKTDSASLMTMQFAQFDDDPRTDVFRVNGTAWEVSFNGRGTWATINQSSRPASQILVGHFDLGHTDDKSDVLATIPALAEDDTNGW